MVGGGTITSQGRAEVFHDGIWGRICHSDWPWPWPWGFEEENVFCEHLGFNGALSVPYSSAFGHGKGIIWMDKVRCSGDEKSITACSHASWGVTSSSHSRDASVMCTPLGD